MILPEPMHPLKPRPLYRSITFWSGLLVMVFLCWGWWDSKRAASSVIFDRHSGFSDRGELSFSNNFPPGMREVDRQVHVHGPGAEPGVSFFPPLLFVRGGGEGGDVQPLPGETRYETATRFIKASPKGIWLLILPYWLLLIVASMGWSGLLLWRARRHRRAMAGMVASP